MRNVTDHITPIHSRIWNVALGESLPASKVLIHGDLHPRNVIVKHDKLAAIIDWRDMTAGDPATDLATLWMLFDNKQIRDKALSAYGGDQAMINRALGWAVFFGLILLDTGLDNNQQLTEIGKAILKRLTQ